MKKFTKLLGIVLIIALVMSMGAMAFAEENPTGGSGAGTETGGTSGSTEGTETGGTSGGSGTGTETGGSTTQATTKTITLTGGKAGHTYTLYQIFTGTVDSTDSKKLLNIQWGTDVTDTFKADKTTAAAYAEEVGEAGNARATAQALIAANALTGGTAKTLSADGNVVFDNLAEGYYIVVDTNGNTIVTEGDYSSAVIVQVVNNVSMALKGSAPTSEKKVDDKNDSDTSEDATTWQDSADYDIGDDVPFQLKATTADNVANYKKYHITFQDKQSAGLDAPTSFTVTVLGKTFTYENSAWTDAQTTDNGTKITVADGTKDPEKTFAITVTFEPTGTATYLDAECNNTVILVNYTSKLNTSAKIGAEGNPNESYIKYSNNPDSSDDSEEGKTPTDKVIVFTYKIDIDKIDETGTALKGADFTLYKQVTTTTDGEGNVTVPTGAQTGKTIKATMTDTKVKAAATALKDDIYYVVVGNKTGSTAGATFEFKGIDDGVYVLVETAVPAGYNAWASAEVTVTATHTNDDDTTPLTLTSLTASDPFKTNAADGWVKSQDVDKKNDTKHTTDSGEMYTEIENNSGTVLPSTGGIGTTIFYVVGSILVIAAGVLLITKKRMSREG